METKTVKDTTQTVHISKTDVRESEYSAMQLPSRSPTSSLSDVSSNVSLDVISVRPPSETHRYLEYVTVLSRLNIVGNIWDNVRTQQNNKSVM